MLIGKAVSIAVLITVIATMVTFCRVEKIEYGSLSSSLVIVKRLDEKRLKRRSAKTLVLHLCNLCPLA